VLVAECGLSRLIEAGRDGQVAKEIKVASQAKNMGHQFRGTRKTADGHYWVCLMDEKKIVELSPTGALLQEIPVDGFPHAAVKLPGEHLLITLGTAGKVIELDKNRKIVWELGENEVMELAAELLEIQNEQELEQFLGGSLIPALAQEVSEYAAAMARIQRIECGSIATARTATPATTAACNRWAWARNQAPPSSAGCGMSSSECQGSSCSMVERRLPCISDTVHRLTSISSAPTLSSPPGSGR
jgi:hypothetical protein